VNERATDPNAISPSVTAHEPVFAHRGLFIENKWGPDLMALADWQDIVDWMADHGMNTLTIGLYGCWTVQYNNQISEFLMVPLPGHPTQDHPLVFTTRRAVEEPGISAPHL